MTQADKIKELEAEVKKYRLAAVIHPFLINLKDSLASGMAARGEARWTVEELLAYEHVARQMPAAAEIWKTHFCQQ